MLLQNSEAIEIAGCIDGVQFEVAPYSLSSKQEGRMIVVPNQAVTTLVWRSPSLKDTEYVHYGIHLTVDDGLIFLTKPSSKPILIDLWDVREASSTAGQHMVITINEVDPRRLLRIPRGVAHLPKNLEGVITLNAQNVYYDSRRLPIPENGDVINIRVEDEERLRRARYPVARYPVPRLFVGFYLKWLTNSLPKDFPIFYEN